MIDTFFLGLKPETKHPLLTKIEGITAKFGEVDINSGIKPGKPSCPIPVSLTIPGPDARKLTRHDLKEGTVHVKYRQKGNEETLIQTLPIEIEPKGGSPDRLFKFIMGFLVLLGIGVLAWMIYRHRSESTARFRLVWSYGTFGAPTVESFTMKKGERLAFSKSEGADHYSEIAECPGTSIVCQGRGKLILVRPHTSEETEMKEGTEYEIETTSGEKIKINLYWEGDRQKDPEGSGGDDESKSEAYTNNGSSDDKHTKDSESDKDDSWL
jgi:hypothetical protein